MILQIIYLSSSTARGKLKRSQRDWTAWFEHYNKLNSYEKICENFIQFLETEHTIKNQLIEFEASTESLEILGKRVKVDRLGMGLHWESGQLRYQLQEHTEVLKMLRGVLDDIQSYKGCLKRYFLRVKKRYYDNSASFINIFKDENVFGSLEKSQAIPGSAKREIALIRLQLEEILPGVESDLRYMLSRSNKTFTLNI